MKISEKPPQPISKFKERRNAQDVDKKVVQYKTENRYNQDDQLRDISSYLESILGENKNIEQLRQKVNDSWNIKAVILYDAEKDKKTNKK